MVLERLQWCSEEADVSLVTTHHLIPLCISVSMFSEEFRQECESHAFASPMREDDLVHAFDGEFGCMGEVNVTDVDLCFDYIDLEVQRVTCLGCDDVQSDRLNALG